MVTFRQYDLSTAGNNMFSAEDAAMTPPQVRSLPVFPGLLRTAMPDAAQGGTNAGVWLTLSSQWALESTYNLVRFIYLQNSATAYTISGVKVSPSSSLSDGNSPVNAAGNKDFTMFVQAGFNNAGLDVAPQDQTVWTGGTTTFTVPANAGNLNVPTRWYSDWVRVASLDRIDGGIYPLMVIRTLTDGVGTFRIANIQVTQAVWDQYSAGRTLRMYMDAADRFTTPTQFAGNTQQLLSPHGVQYMSSSMGYTVLSCGDSLTAGIGGNSQRHGWGVRSAQALSTPARPVSWMNQGVNGQTSDNFWSNAYQAYKGCKAEIVTFPVYSPNDGFTQATADTTFSRAMDFANYVIRQGSTPVLMGPLPWTPITTTVAENARLSARTRMLNAAAQGMQVLDWEQSVGTGAFPNRLQPALVSGDGNHPSDAGYDIMDAAVFRPVLAQLIK